MIISAVLIFSTSGSAQENVTDNTTNNITDNATGNATDNATENVTNSAVAVLKDANGSTVAFAIFTENVSGVRVQVIASGLKPGMHGIHIHEKANCTEPLFTSAGGHYNPMEKEHGLDNPNGPHAGDLPNLVVGEDGTGYMDATTDLVTLTTGPNTLFTSNGTSLVIHDGSDDQMTDPAGDSGNRTACGVIEKI